MLDLEVPEEEVVKRIAGRRICRNDSSHVFHVTYSAPKQEGVCDVCGGELYQRDDDSEETVRKRLEVYHTQTEPIIDYYKAQGLVVTISSLGPVDEDHAAGPGGPQAREGREVDPEPSAAVPSRAPRPYYCTGTPVDVSDGERRPPMVQIKTPEQIAKMGRRAWS